MKTDWMLTKENYSQSNWIPVRLVEKCTVRRREIPRCNMLHYTHTVCIYVHTNTHTHTHLVFVWLWCLDAAVIWGTLASVVQLVSIMWWTLTAWMLLMATEVEYKREWEGTAQPPTSDHVWCLCHLLPHPTLHRLPFISGSLIGFANCERGSHPAINRATVNPSRPLPLLGGKLWCGWKTKPSSAH